MSVDAAAGVSRRTWIERWFAPATAGSIVAYTAAGVICGSLFDAGFSGGTGALVCVAFMVVSVAGVVQLRLIVLPAVFRQLADAPRPDMSDRAAREAGAAPTPGPEGSAGRYTADSPYVLAFAFAVSPAIYGLVAAILLGHGWLAAPFGAIALVALALLAPYLASEMQRASLARRMQAA